MSNATGSKRYFWLIVGVVVIGGLLAGFLGELLTNLYIFPNTSPLNGEVNLANLNANRSGLVINDAKKVVVNEDVKVTETISGLQPVLVRVFKEVASSSPTSGVKANYYRLDQPLFVGLIITSDGWVVASVPADIKNDFKFKNYVVIGGDRQTYAIDKLADLKNVPGDPLIFHLVGASNLPVKKILDRSELSLGESLLVLNGLNTVWPTTLTSLTETPGVASSDAVDASLNLADSASENFKDSFVFDLAGNLAAIITDKQAIIPAFYYNFDWQMLLNSQPGSQPLLGVNYLNLSLIKTDVLNLDKGAWLYPSAIAPAVLKDSPAEAAGLQAGDVITWINNQEIDATDDLADVLATYHAGDQITVTYQRAGVEKSTIVTLGALK